ncbi:uncharacterized protein LOC142996108 [Genypterus blacodes]|uniref:uncharacterized protein LOC142996108 n=1 Tax=Genypterus blacodes TaxID=154954 RepID=UPI003F769CEB
MSHSSLHEPPAPALSSDSGQTLPSRRLQPTSDPSASKRVCFYKSGDYKFTGQRLVINARTFKTFDALLDALSKKVPLPFGVRIITTPRGTHSITDLHDLHDGGSYVCSDHKRVKPLNLDEVNRQQVPWNTTRPVSAGRRGRRGAQLAQLGRRKKVLNRPARINDRMAVRTPKRLVVIKNRDPSAKQTIVLHKRTAPTFDALLDYLSQIMQFPVLKLYTTDGRRIDGLAAIILCSGVVIAAGNEPFRLGNNNSGLRKGNMAQAVKSDAVEPSSMPPLEPRPQNRKTFSSGRGSRKFSVSSEQYMVNQINKSRNGGLNNHPHHHNGPNQSDVNQPQTPADTETHENAPVDPECHTTILPEEDEIEKSFRVNQDGSMTVDMKVRLTIKEEEMLHWTTTLSRSSLSKGPVCASVTGSGNISPDSNMAFANGPLSITEEESKEENHSAVAGGKSVVGFSDEREYEGDASKTSGKIKPSFKRVPTPGLRRVKKKESVESVRMVTVSGVQESRGYYSYTERTSDGETAAGHCVVRHSSSSSSSRPVPKPRRTASAGASKKVSCTSLKSAGVAEVLQIQNNGMEITETVMHIYESQGCYNNYLANTNHYSSEDMASLCSNPMLQGEPASSASEPHSPNNDCDVDLNWQPASADSPHRWKEEILSLSSETNQATPEVRDDLMLRLANSEAQIVTNSQIQSPHEDKKVIQPSRKSFTSVSSSKVAQKVAQKQKNTSPLKNTKNSSANKLSNADVGKKSSSKMAKGGQKSKPDEKVAIKKSSSDDNGPRKSQSLLLNTSRKTLGKKLTNTSKAAAKVNGPNVNVKKNTLDVLKPKKSVLPDRKMTIKPKSKTLGSSFNSSASDVHQYVENWLHNVSQYREEGGRESPQTKPVFQIGDDSESEESPECDAVKTLEDTAVTPNEQEAGDLCDSTPTAHEENRLQTPQTAESNILSPKAKIQAVLRQIRSTVQNIRGVSESVSPSNLQKSRSLPDFSSQVALVFGSPCKVFLAFLAAVTLRDVFKGRVDGDSRETSNTSEAMQLMESLLRISAVEDEEEQRAKLMDLQSRTSSKLRERWREFQILRDGLENESIPVKVSEREVTWEVNSEGGDVFDDQHLDIAKLMEELCIQQDLRGEISKSFDSVARGKDAEEEEEEEVNEEVNEENSEEEFERLEEDAKGGEEVEEMREVNAKAEQEETDEEDEEEQGDELNEGCEDDGERVLEEADPKGVESLNNTLYEVQCEDEKDEDEEGSEGHPVRISQELLDFVNAALQSSSLIFTYDTQGNIRIEPDNIPGIQAIPKCREDPWYGLKRLPSPSTSDLSELSDYRPETSESGGYQTQQSLDVFTESEEGASGRTSPDKRPTTETQRTKSSVGRHSGHVENSRLKSAGSFSSCDSGAKASTESLSPASPLKALDCVSFNSEKDSNDGVLIDKGRWLLRENHLIRKSPPVSNRMYDDLDSASTDTSHDYVPRGEAPPHPLKAISSSELEEMAKPSTPKCTYFNMSHGSDSDPFLDDDASVKNGRKGTSGGTGKGPRVSPTVDTNKNWANKNGSLSSFASVEFRPADRRVHPEDQSPAVAQATTPSSARRHVMQVQDSMETLRVRCGQYCPIL